MRNYVLIVAHYRGWRNFSVILTALAVDDSLSEKLLPFGKTTPFQKSYYLSNRHARRVSSAYRN